MSYTVLARRYRSQTFDDIVGQEHIAQTLKSAISSGRISHAYLFCGTRGTGKTSTARILAKALNCQSFDAPTPTPCGKCDSCLAIARGDDIDVIEIDAASHTGVDNVREIIENSQYRPARSRFKIYIIDEVHMLSKSAFNALLKTLEEPPSHVKFILATTEPEKVLATILSRCQRYDFRNISSRQIAGHLLEICKKEKIKADEDALAMIARAGAGSMRDALSLLDRLLSLGEKHLTAKTIEEMLGLPPTQRVAELVSAIGGGDVKSVLSQTDAILSSGLSSDALLAGLVDFLRNLLISRTCGKDSELVDIPGYSADELAELAEKFDPVFLTQDITILEELRRNIRQNQTGRALLDATLVRLSMSEQFASINELLSNLDGAKPPAARPTPPIQKKKPEPSVALPAPIVSSPAPISPPAIPADSGSPTDLWPRLIEKLGSTLAAPLSLATLRGIEDNQAVIRFAAEGATFAQAWSSNGKKDAIAKALTELTGRPMGVRFEVSDAAPAPVRKKNATEIESDPLVQAVLREFAGTVME
jgi:DNA polymerase-3 subunit gamma/tau